MAGFFDSLGTLFGGGSNNVGYQAGAAPIMQPSTLDQANQQYGQVQSGLGQQQALVNALQAQNGLGNQSSVFNQLQGVANGTGPNPAQAMLNQATGQNVANQAALMAGQRGAAANPGELARQAAMQGAATQQNAVGQGATLQANQSLGALGQLGGLANQQAANQIGATQGYNQAAQGAYGQTLGGIGAQNTAGVQMQGNVNNANEGIAAINSKGTQQTLGGLLGGISGASIFSQGPAGQALSGGSTSGGQMSGAGGTASLGDYSSGLAHGGEVENPKLATVPEADRFKDSLYPSHLKDMADVYHGTKYAMGGMAMKQGGDVPGKAKVEGDSLKNDTVKAMLSPGEVVIPKSVMESDDPVAGAAQFVAALQKKKGGSEGGGDHKAEFKEALKKAVAGRKSK